MKKINIAQDYNHIKLLQQRHITEVISEIEKNGGLGNEREIDLNIEGCITDYPATPKFIDYFLNHLSNLKGKKKLDIIFDGLGNKEVYILYNLILEGDFFKINDKIESDEEVDKWKEIINRKLKESNIVLQVNCKPNGKKYYYGS